MLYALGVLVLAVGLLLSIALHEIGHLVPAKKFGVKVTQYMVGFGPTLFSRKRGETEYGIKGIPLGGYIRMIGMVPPRQDGRPSRWPRRLATAVEDFRQASRAEVRPGDEDREFYRLTPGKKMIVMLGGPCMNLLIYLVLSFVLLGTIGVEHLTSTTAIGSVTNCVAPANASAAASTACTSPNAPAKLAGLQGGDVITAVGSTKITSWDQFTTIIHNSAGKTLSVTVRRDGKPTVLSITPVLNKTYASDGTTLIEAGWIGVSDATHDYFQIPPAGQIPGLVASGIGTTLSAVGSYPQRVASVWGTVFDGKARSPNSAVGVVGIGRIGGDVAQSSTLTFKGKVVWLLAILATVNLFLFFVNLLPLLPLDGGHVAGALVESAKRGRARLRARRTVRPAGGARSSTRPQIFVDTAQMVPVAYLVASVLIVISLITLYADIVKPINLGS